MDTEKVKSTSRLLEETKTTKIPDSIDTNSDSKTNEKPNYLVKTTSSSVQVVCQKDQIYCDTNEFIFYPQIDYANYKLEIELKTTGTSLNFDKFLFDAYTLNTKYTIFITILKMIFFVTSIISGIAYIRFYKRLNPFIKTFEHKAIYVLSIMLIFFNDPFSLISLWLPYLFFEIMTSLFYSVFLTGLIIFWIVMLQRVHKEPTTPETKLLFTKTTIVSGKYFLFFLRYLRNEKNIIWMLILIIKLSLAKYHLYFEESRFVVNVSLYIIIK